MEWTSTNKHATKHHITMEAKNDGLHLNIVRLRTCGGIPKTIVKIYAVDISFKECMTKVNIIVELDDELYTMVSEASGL